MYKYEKDFRRVLRIPEHENGVEVMAYCPFHENKNSPAMQVNLKTGLWVCFVCERKKNGVSRPLGGNYNILLSMLGLSSNGSKIDLNELSQSLQELKDGSLSTGIRKSKYSRMNLMNEADLRPLMSVPTDYWSSRGFRDETIKHYKLGYDLFNGTVTIPLRDEHGLLLGVIRRQIGNDSGAPRYAYPKGFPRKDSLFNYDQCKGERDLIIVEGSLDAMRVWEAVGDEADVVAQYGSSMSDNQAKLIRLLLPHRVWLFHDNDTAGAKASEQARQVLKGLDCKRLHQVEGYDDPADTPVSALRHYLKEKSILKRNKLAKPTMSV